MKKLALVLTSAAIAVGLSASAFALQKVNLKDLKSNLSHVGIVKGDTVTFKTGDIKNLAVGSGGLIYAKKISENKVRLTHVKGKRSKIPPSQPSNS